MSLAAYRFVWSPNLSGEEYNVCGLIYSSLGVVSHEMLCLLIYHLVHIFIISLFTFSVSSHILIFMISKAANILDRVHQLLFL